MGMYRQKQIASGFRAMPALMLIHKETIVPIETWQYPLSSPYLKALEVVGWKVAQKEITHFHNGMVKCLSFSCQFPRILN